MKEDKIEKFLDILQDEFIGFIITNEKEINKFYNKEYKNKPKSHYIGFCYTLWKNQYLATTKKLITPLKGSTPNILNNKIK